MRVTQSLLPLGAALLLVLPAASGVSAQENEGGHEMDMAAHAGMTMPESGIRAELIADFEASAGKFESLAHALEGHWDWRPAEGVRSVGEVIGHVAATNLMIPTMMGIDPPESFQGADQQETMGNLMALENMTHDEMMEHLAHSFRHAGHALARVGDERLDEPVRYFGQEGTIRSLMVLMSGHMHEHLGQLIAYARANGVVPPWSAAGQ